MKKKPIRHIIIYLWTLPLDIIAWLTVLFVWLFWGTKLHWLEGLWCELKPDSWPTMTWYRRKIKGLHKINPPEFQKEYGTWLTWGGTTLGHGGFYGPGRSQGSGIDTVVEYHEHIHVEQAEVSMLITFIIGLFIFMYLLMLENVHNALIAGILVWISGCFLFAAGGWVTAWFRGEDPYMGSQHEESAYAQTSEHYRDLN